MKNKFLKILKLAFITVVMQFFFANVYSQYKSYDLTVDRDTINAIDKKGLKQGMWVVSTPELRGEPGYEEEGKYKNGKKDGIWKRFNANGDLIAVERYKYGGKDGVQQYFTMMGDLGREESWKSYNPDAPYDTIPIYGTGSNEIINFKIVKIEQYSVKHGLWKWYDPTTGRMVRSETYDRGFPPKEPEVNLAVKEEKKKVKPAEVLDYEKKNSGKKKVKTRDGATGY